MGLTFWIASVIALIAESGMAETVSIFLSMNAAVSISFWEH